MSVIGRVVNVTRQGALVVQGSKPVPLGSKVVDAMRAPVGKVLDVIGPVKAPYIVVGLKGPVQPASLLGKELHSQSTR